MIILWIRRNDKDEPSPYKDKDEESFRTHDERMKRFRVAHPRIETVKQKEASPSGFRDLVPVRGVRLAEYSHN